MDIDKLKQKLSPKQYIQVLEFIARGNFSLEKLQLLETDSSQRLKQLQTDLTDCDRFLSGIQFSILGKIRRIDEKLRTENQKSLLEKYSPQELEQQYDDFRVVQVELIDSEQQHLDLIKEVRQHFEDAYPEATLSPRSSRQELETSPTRFMGKSHSFPSHTDLASPRSSLENSPRRLFRKSLGGK